MPEYTYSLSNGKSLVLEGNEPPSDEEVERLASEQGVSLVPANTEITKPIERLPVVGMVPELKGPIPSKSDRPAGLGRVDEQVFDTSGIHERLDSNKTRIGNALADKTGSFWPTAIGSGAYNLAADAVGIGADFLADPISASIGMLQSAKGRLPQIAEEVIAPAPSAKHAFFFPDETHPKGGFEQYNVTGGPYDRSTVGIDRLNELGIEIPYTPNRPPRALLPQVTETSTDIYDDAGRYLGPKEPDSISIQERPSGPWDDNTFANGQTISSEVRPQSRIPEMFDQETGLPRQTDFIAGDAGTLPNEPRLVDGPLGVNYRTEMGKGTVLPNEIKSIEQVSPELPTSGIYPTPNDPLDSLMNELGVMDKPHFKDRMGLGTYTGTGHARPGEPQLPSAPFRERIKKNITQTLEAQEVDKTIAPKIAEVVTDVPELASTIQEPNFIKKYLTSFNRRETPGSRFTAKLGNSIDSELTNQHPQLGELVKQTQADSHIKAGTWIAKYDNSVESLTDNEFNNFVGAIEKKAEPLNDKIKSAIEGYKKLDQEISEEMASTGAGLKSSDGTKTIPWEARENYWPHLYTEDFFKTLKNNPTELKQRLTDAGMAPLEIDALLSNSKKFGERLIDAQHTREANIPGYRTDKNVYRQHITEMAKRIVEAKNYGPLDLADIESPIMSLIGRTKNPEYSTSIMKKLLNRGEVGDFDSIDISRKATAAQAWLHLSTAGISNMNSLAMTPIQTSTKSFVKGIAETLLNNAQTSEFAKESGALQNIFKEIFAAAIDDTTKFMPTKVYGLDAGERFMRTISSSAGRSYAKELFNEVKSGNVTPAHMRKLQELTLTSPEDLVKQTELNGQQLKRAAFRTAELSQGLAETQNLPQYWTGSGLANILTLFHKYQFAQTKIVKDLIKANPARSIPMLLGASQIAGEITGDSKAFIRGLVKTGYSGEGGKIEDEIMNRGDFIGKKFGLEDSPMMARFIENMGQSFALGIYADVLEAMAGGGSDVLKQLAGSTLNDLMKAIDISKDLVSGNMRGAATKGTSLVPLVGPPVAAEMREDVYDR